LVIAIGISQIEALADALDSLFMNVLPIPVRVQFLNAGKKLTLGGRQHTVTSCDCGSLPLYAHPDHCVKKQCEIFFIRSL